MEISDFLSPNDALVGVRADNKSDLLQRLAAHASAALRLDSAAIARGLSQREQLGSTGVGNGIAIPHARYPEIARPFGIIAQLITAIEFDAIDGAPVDLVFLLLQPAAAQSDLNALAAVARTLRESDRLKSLRQAADASVLYREITR